MKTLLTLALTFIAFSASAESSNFNCASQTRVDKNSSICSSSLLSDATKLAYNCPAQVREKSGKDSTVQ